MSVYEEGECGVPYHRGAIFTVELGCLVDNGFDLGLDEYPIFDEAYRAPLNAKIVEHFFFREIGLETPALFRRFLNRKMNEVMPFYNQLYRSALMEFDPFGNYDMETTGSSSAKADQSRDCSRTESSATNAVSSTVNDTGSRSRTLVSVTPQMQLSGHEDYATNITDGDSTTNAKGDSTQEGSAASEASDTTKASTASTEDYVTRVSGISGITKSQALMQFRETFLNIDMMVIGELNELFMGIYTDYWNAL